MPSKTKDQVTKMPAIKMIILIFDKNLKLFSISLLWTYFAEKITAIL